ncbi:unnamed protein product [Rangifer tarandus platyrhynchus]|uniref:Uncharacterized protein n=1 Tax=Rangifer tarandus platyrhynchus TaxID=3082113 RepID=A0AC59ZUK4_RANTA
MFCKTGRGPGRDRGSPPSGLQPAGGAGRLLGRPPRGRGNWLPRARRRSLWAPGRGDRAGLRVQGQRAGRAAGGAAGSRRGGTGRGAKGAGPRAGGGGGGGGGGGSRGGGGGGGGVEHGGRGERLKCLFFRPGERESDAILEAFSLDGRTAASSASATLFPVAPSSGACVGSVLHPPLRGDPLAPEEGAGEPRRRRRRAPGPSSGGGRGDAATVAGERGARQRGPEAAAAAAAAAGEWRAAGAEPPGGCSCHEPRGRRGPRGREQLAPPPPPALLSLRSSPPPPTFPEFSLGLARLEGAEVAAVTGTSWGLRRGGKLLQQRLWLVRVS